jgi:hypothetical protein
MLGWHLPAVFVPLGDDNHRVSGAQGFVAVGDVVELRMLRLSVSDRLGVESFDAYELLR